MRTKKLRSAVCAFGLVVAGTLGVVAGAGPAAADPSCYGDNCTGQNPYSSGCANDAYVWATADLAYDGGSAGTVQLMVSPSCGTRWAYANFTDGSFNSGIQVTAKQSTGFTEQTPNYSGAGTYYTEMTYSRSDCSTASASFGVDRTSDGAHETNTVITGCGLF